LYKAAAVLSALMKIYAIPCHDRGHIIVMLVLQSCTDSVQDMPGLSIEAFPSSDGTYYVANMKVDEDVDEVCFKAINKEADIGVKQEEIPDIKTDADKVS
jgi:hypothetical protein